MFSSSVGCLTIIVLGTMGFGNKRKGVCLEGDRSPAFRRKTRIEGRQSPHDRQFWALIVILQNASNDGSWRAHELGPDL
jgi:hypothetical protein